MIILTSANKDQAKNDSGEVHKKFSFRGVIGETIRRAEECGYKTDVYDLGTLGIGEPYLVQDKTFSKKGYYEKEVVQGYKSKSLFKPALVKLCMAKHDDLVAYLDGDAQLVGCLDDVDTDDYDIGVTLRTPLELDSEWYKAHKEVVKFVNAGVIFFRPTRAALDFVNTWLDLTDTIGNDQMALNKLTCTEDYPEVGSVQVLNGARIKYFPCRLYNFYHFEDGISDDIRILHFKGPVRHYYPFNKRKRLYCKTIVPLLNFFKKIVKS